MADNEFMESQRALSTLMDNLPGIAYRCKNDEQWTMEFISNGCFELTGYAPDELIDNRKLSYSDIILPGYRQMIWEEVQNALLENQPFKISYKIRTKSGAIKWVWEQGCGVFSGSNEVLALEGFITDITERKQAEEELGLLHSLTLAINKAHNFDDAIKQILTILCRTVGWNYGEAWIPSRDKSMLECSPAYYCSSDKLKDYREISEAIKFLPGQGLPGRIWISRQPEWIGDIFLQSERSFIRYEEALHAGLRTGFGFPIISGNTILAVLVFLISGIHEEAERLTKLFTTISIQLGYLFQRKIAEDALKNSEEQYRRLVELSPIGIAIHHSGKIVYVNLSAVKMMRAVNSDELIGKSVIQFVHPDYKEMVNQRIQMLLDDNQPAPLMQEKFIRLDGETIDVEVVSLPFRYDGKQAVQVVFRDITEQKELQEQLIRAQKMEAIGKLAGGIAHDFNNLLTVINGYGSLLQTKLPEEAGISKEIDMICKAGDRAASLTNQLLAFSRRQIVQFKVLNLNQVIIGIEKMLDRLIGEDIDLVTYLDEKLGNVKADESQVEQILMNLAVNARDAMPRGGKITIETRNVDFDKQYTEHHMSMTPGSYIMFAVSDTGSGMDEQTKRKIFDPFFTTKGKSEGTGLGLSTVYGIVKQSKGHIWVYSEIGKGTTFKIYLPRIAGELDIDYKMTPAPKTILGSETVLLVEDDKDVRKFSRTALLEYGYNVLEAEDGPKALQVCNNYRRPIHLIITDVIMPQMSGKELADKVSAMYPGLKVLFVSGYTDSAIVHHGILDATFAYLPKPFSPESLARKVREVLESD